jgi:preprotein translocase subunit SecE
MDIIKPIFITATIPVIIFIGGICLFFIGIDHLYESYHAYFFNNYND